MATKTASNRKAKTAHLDTREQLFNSRQQGPVNQIQLPTDCITQLHGVLYDLDPDQLRRDGPVPVLGETPKDLYRQTVKAWLDRDEVLKHAEVRVSGRGLHALLWFESPVEINTDAERRRWGGIVKALQCALPVDPDQPGITATTRPVGSTNSKNKRQVRSLSSGTPVSTESVLALFERLSRAPFRTVAGILLGSDCQSPCPLCGDPQATLDALDRNGRCYGSCGSVGLADLYDALLVARAADCKASGRSSKKEASRGRDLAKRLARGCQEAEYALRRGARDLPVLRGVSRQGTCNRPLDNVQVDAAEIMAKSEKVFVYGDDVVIRLGDDRALLTLAQGNAIAPSAASMLANIFVCEDLRGDNNPVQFPLPQSFVGVLLNADSVRQTLPTIKFYAKRPIFDTDFNLLSRGWHATKGALIDGPDVDPIVPDLPRDDPEILNRLPEHLGALLSGFCFRDAADVANYVGCLLTGLLVDRFVVSGKPMLTVDGNKPGLGKTLLVQVLSMLLDGLSPGVITYTSDDADLEKRVGATVREGNRSVILVDNAKTGMHRAISSATLESRSTSPVIQHRILGTSSNFERPNNLIWAVTMNDTRLSRDLVSRGLPVRLFLESDPGKRSFGGFDPLSYAQEHRAELLGELAGMAVAWNQAGRPDGTRAHRFEPWARMIGGILEHAGFPEFLANVDAAAASFDQGVDDLAALAEKALAEFSQQGFFWDRDREPGSSRVKKQHKTKPRGVVASGWKALFDRAQVLTEPLREAKSTRAIATAIGTFLSSHVGREFEIEVAGAPRRVSLFVDAATKGRRYYFATVQPNGEGEPSANVAPRDGADRSIAEKGSTSKPPTNMSSAASRHLQKKGNDEDWS
jgi:hypothetical protein